MNKRNFILTLATGVLMINGLFANNTTSEKDERVISSVNYIEEDVDFELGFDTTDYLPEDFNPHRMYVNLDDVTFIEDERIDALKTKKYLPKGFNAYAYPTEVSAINYIDETDEVSLGFDSQALLPKDFDAFKRIR